MAATARRSAHEAFRRLLRDRHSWKCLAACTLLFLVTLSAGVSCSSMRGTIAHKQAGASAAGQALQQTHQARAAAEETVGDPHALDLLDDEGSDAQIEDEANDEDLEEEDDTFGGMPKNQFSPAEPGKEPEVVGTILAVGRRANPKLDNSKETLANAGEFEKIRSGSWEAPAYSVVTDEDLENNVVVEKVLRPSETFSLQLPRKLSTSPQHLTVAAHPVVMGECDTLRTVPYTDIFSAASSSYKFWTAHAGSGSGSKLVFAAPSEDVVMRSGKNTQFCFKVFDVEKDGFVTVWVQVRTSGLFPPCADGNCQTPLGIQSTEIFTTNAPQQAGQGKQN